MEESNRCRIGFEFFDATTPEQITKVHAHTNKTNTTTRRKQIGKFVFPSTAAAMCFGRLKSPLDVADKNTTSPYTKGD